MDQSSITHDFSISSILTIGFGVADPNNDRQSDSSSIESFEQLYFSKIPFNQIENIDQRVIERWSSIDQPSMTFYRVYIQDNSDNFYQPVTEKRLHSFIEQSKAMEYVDLEMNFF
ncbi:unnamed protein product [Rotaria sp. Silwood2]|nr:unnamed protein product [Rotaria sp. Silwood2]CAF4402160.1 unnamed protein product [Rotaria sp. Silwood2]